MGRTAAGWRMEGRSCRRLPIPLGQTATFGRLLRPYAIRLLRPYAIRDAHR